MDMNHYLEKYQEILENIDKINSTLDKEENIESLNVFEDISSCVNSFKEMKTIDRYSLSEEEIKEIDNKNDEIKEAIIKLKNKQIYKYNLQVEKINEKIRLMKSVSSLMNEDDIYQLKLIKYCNVYISSDWKRNSYNRLLDYDKLIEVSEQITLIEEKYNIKNNDSIDLGVKINYFEELLEASKKEVKEDMTLVEVKELLDKCMDIYGNVIDLDISARMYYENGNLSKETYSKYNHDTIRLSNETSKFMLDLLMIKKNVDDRSNDYTVILDKLDIVELQISKLEENNEKNYGKCSGAILNRYKVYLGKINLSLKAIENETNGIVLNSEQKRRLTGENGRFEIIHNLLENVSNKLKNDPYILGENIDTYVDDTLKEIEEDIKLFEAAVSILEDKVYDVDKVERVNEIADKIKGNISNIDSLLAKTDRVDLQNRLNEYNDKFNIIRKSYNSKRPLLVKKIKPADSVYNKYKKECLEISGLSSFSLLNNPVLIPTIMHGNEVLQQKIPALKSFTNFVNNVLGGVINARKNEKGEWFLSNGYKIGPSVACTSLLKNLALSNSKLVNAPLIQKVKGLMTKMQLKKNKLVNKFHEGLDEIEKRKVENKFRKSGLTPQEFADTNELSDIE